MKKYSLLSLVIQGPIGKFDLTKDRKRFSMDWYYPILSGVLNNMRNYAIFIKFLKILRRWNWY